MKRIKYVSQFAESLSRAEVEEIERQCERNNPGKGITGVLVATGRLFFQILEGPSREVDELYATICADPRHKDVVLLKSEAGVAERLYPDWAMKALSIDEESQARLAPLRALIEAVHVQGKLMDGMTNTIERSAWEEIATRMKT